MKFNKNIYTSVFLFLLLTGISIHPKANPITDELKGTIIFSDQCNEANNPVSKAFDNNINTYFNSCSQFGNWIGLDLTNKHVITKIAYCPRVDSDYRHRLRLGVFEGANNPDFGDAIPLFIIPGLTERELTEQEIQCTRGFRYVRFVFPTPQESGKSSYMGELKFYGYQSEGDDSQLACITNIPTVSIHTVKTQDITSLETYVKGIVSVIAADGKSIYTDSLDIRGRGNNSWSHPKKPYRMKLYHKARLLNFPAKEKNWTLINNFGDKTLMRNLVGFDISRRMELPYTPAGAAVNVFLNGDYKGCYQLCDQIEVNDKRIEVEKMQPTDISLPNLAGGYLLEIDAYAYSEPSWFESSVYHIPVTIKYPKDDEIVLAQKQYIEQCFNELVAAANAWNYADEKQGFRKYLDTKSFLRYFLAGELNGNTDTFWSMYISKSRTSDQFIASPIWDLDLAFDNDNRTYPINTRCGDKWIYASLGSTANGMASFVNRLMSDQKLQKEMREIYSYYRNRKIISADALIKVVDDYAEELDQSQQLNFTRWPIMNQYVHQNPILHGSYQAEVENIKYYIQERIEWMDKKLNYVPNPVDNILQPTHDALFNIKTEPGMLFLTGIHEPASIRITDISGKNVINNMHIQADVSIALQQGVYLISTFNEKGKNSVYKCIVP